MKSKQYDEETQTGWQVTFFKIGAGLEHPDLHSPEYGQEITPDKAATEAAKRGYDGFEIAEIRRTVRRYEVLVDRVNRKG